MVAALTGSAPSGAAVMALFALGTSVSMMAGPWLWLRLKASGNGDWGVRVAGLALAASSVWALWMAFAHDAAPWCTVPG
jgi:sulfite exporter TauE/SafE